MRYDTRMEQALEILRTYSGEMPLALFLRKHFRAHRAMGSGDRKELSALLFGYFRLKGRMIIEDPKPFLIRAASGNPLLHAFYAHWKAEDILPRERPAFASYFPFAECLSPSVAQEAFYAGHFMEPRTFIRVRDGFMNQVTNELHEKHFHGEVFAGGIAFGTHYPLDKLDSYAAGFFEIQDIASQACGVLFDPKPGEIWWDCCAGSGGKSLMLLDKEPRVQLFVSDSRAAMLDNLRERFVRHGYVNYSAFTADLCDADDAVFRRIPPVDVILADLPCSGSGTWVRSPERLTFFTERELDHHVAVQRNILHNALRLLKSGGRLIFLTCSVYAAENENNIAFHSRSEHLELLEQHYFQFAAEGGETMFGAKLRKR